MTITIQTGAEGDSLNSRPVITSRAFATVAVVLMAACTPAQDNDLRSYRLGSITTWSEAVSVDIKELALGSPLTTDETDALIEEATRIAGQFGVSVHREPDLLVSDLFRSDIAHGKQVLLFYQPPTLDKYLCIEREESGTDCGGRVQRRGKRGNCQGFWPHVELPGDGYR